MENFLLYLLKASALLGVFYLSYFFLLKKETSFELNRKFMIGGIFTSALLPFIYLTKKVYVEASASPFNYIMVTSEATPPSLEQSIDWWNIAGIIYFIVTISFLLRLCLQLITVARLILSHKSKKENGLNYLQVSENQLPFSFFNYIAFNPEKHSQKDLDLILEHERVHATQLHSVDIILVNLVSCILWFNPFAWLYKKSVEQNLEFIADK